MSLMDDLAAVVLKHRPELAETEEQEKIRNTKIFFECPCCKTKQDVLDFCSKTGTKYTYCRTCRNGWQKLRKHLAIQHPQPEYCALCGKPFDKYTQGLRPEIDHDHDTGEYRDWLHANCNKAIGMLNTQLMLQQAIEYFKKHNLK